jgi:uncharacterized membrane protein
MAFRTPKLFWIAIATSLLSTCCVVVKLKAAGILMFGIGMVIIGTRCLFFGKSVQAEYMESLRRPSWLGRRFPAVAAQHNRFVESRTTLWSIRSSGVGALLMGAFLLWMFIRIVFPNH